jgi:predicted porin
VRSIATLVICCLTFCFVDDARSEDRLAESYFSGYAKSFAVATDEVNTDFLNLKTTYQSQNSVRLMWEMFGDNTVWQVHYEISPVFVSRKQPVESQTFNVVGESYRLTDLKSSLSDEDSKHQLYQNLDRLNVQLQFEQGDLTIGRQAISFGSARFINPTDIFLPFNVQTLNQEYRTGVDAIRYQSPLGELGEFDVGIVLGKDAKPENSAAFLQLRGNVNGKDLQFALTRFAEQTLVGAGIQTALGDFGFWFEAANVTGDFDYLRSSIGLDYAFTENIFAMVEYHYNGAGSDNPDDYLLLLETLPYRQGGVFLLGKEYIMPSVSIQASALWSVGFQGIYNLSDDSAFLSVSAEYNVAEDFYMDFGYYHFTGDELTIVPPGIPVLQSEYGTNPDTIFVSLRFYF